MSGPQLKARVNINLGKANGISRERVERGIRAVGLDAEALVKDILSQPGQGKVYQRGNVSHRASRPGDAPAIDTGRLRNSVSHDVIATPTGAVATVSANTEYAAALELGTERMQERPFLRKLRTQYADRLRRVFIAYAKG